MIAGFGRKTLPLSMPKLVDLDHPENWPIELLSVLNHHYELLRNWEERTKTRDANAYDQAICDIDAAMRPFAIKGWHCTRLTDEEISSILAHGLQLPDASMLYRRIDALVRSGAVTAQIAENLKSTNQAQEKNRVGMVWFCFFPPRLAGEKGIARFFRHWGGEALYNSHESNPVTSKQLRCIGMPCIVEAEVPVTLMPKSGGFSAKIVRRFLVGRGHVSVEPSEHEDRIKWPLPADQICRVIRFPEPDFVELTGCRSWRRPLD